MLHMYVYISDSSLLVAYLGPWVAQFKRRVACGQHDIAWLVVAGHEDVHVIAWQDRTHNHL